jgi:spore germination protein GerM
MEKKVELTVLFLLMLSGVVLMLNWLKMENTREALRRVTSFEACADAGYLVHESYPRQCRTPDGRLFVEVLDRSTGTNEVPVKLYWGNTTNDPKVVSCETTHPTIRLVRSTQTSTLVLASKAIAMLLEGPNAAEKEQGSFTSINSDTALRSLTIQNGVAHADFDNNLQYRVGGSCRVMAITSQIRSTLLQFPEIRDVVISVLGKTDAILQP